MACCVISFTALADLYRNIDSLSRSLSRSLSLSLFLSLACIATSTRKLPPWQSPSSTCSRCPRNARLIMASGMMMFIIQRNTFSRRSLLSRMPVLGRDQGVDPDFQRQNAMLASRCDWVFSCALIFTPKFFGLPCTQLAHSFCIANGSPSNQQH